MNKHIITGFYILLICIPLYARAETEKAPTIEPSPIRTKVAPKIKQGSKEKNTPENKIWFKFKDEPLVDIVTYLAAEKKLNIVLPAGQEAITQKITVEFPEKITLDQAWTHLLTFLRLSGFTIVPHSDFHFITGTDPKGTKDANKQTYPLYINVKPEDLPKNDEKINYVYYFANLQLGGSSDSSSSFLTDMGGSTSSVTSILQALLSKDATIITDQATNGVVITDYARTIASIMNIITELDTHGFHDTVEIIPLDYTSADTIASLLQNLITPTTSQNPNAPADSASQYFASSTRVIPEKRTNSLIMMGKKEALEKANAFIKKHLDVPLDTGESILHIYDLQYLKATAFQNTLQQIVNSSASSSSGQSTGTTGQNPGEQYFKEVIIQAEASGPSTSTSGDSWSGYGSSSQVSAPASPAQSSNRLIIAARKEDWLRIKKLIEELDKPQLQVAIEVLIVDLTLEDNKALGSQIRNKSGMDLKGVNFQTSHMGGLQLKGGNAASISSPADALMGNLLQLSSGNNLANQTTAGSLILSFNDSSTNGMWLVSQVLSKYKDIKVLSQPFIVALNNQESSFTQNDTRLVLGDATVSSGGALTQQVPKTASLGVSMRPLISGSGKINLAINIKVEEFGASFNTLSRTITTNANINDGEVLVLGGLTKTKISNEDFETPALSKVPVLGWLFKNKNKNTTKENLVVFICPRIISTKQDGLVDPFTKDKMFNMSNVLARGENFDSIKDPITRWFFGSANSNDEIATKRVEAFEKKHMYASEKEYIFDRYKTGARTITLNATDPVDQRNVMERSNILPTPPIKPSKRREQPTTLKVASTIRVERPVKKQTILPQNLESLKTGGEQDEFKKLFAELKNPLA